ncbi:hypothetical protein DFAR_3800045 [Desulfarculales bacterium]
MAARLQPVPAPGPSHGQRVRPAKPVPVGPRLLLRLRHTRSQVGLIMRGHQDNVAGAFAVNSRQIGLLLGRRMVLVDDVYATGATVGECARVLKEAGAALGLPAVVRGLRGDRPWISMPARKSWTCPRPWRPHAGCRPGRQGDLHQRLLRPSACRPRALPGPGSLPGRPLSPGAQFRF